MSLKVWLPLDGTLENKGISNVGIIDSNIAVNASGKIGSCYSFNGSSSYIKLDQSFVTNSTTEFSYTCWVKFNSTASACLFSARTATNSNGITLFVNNSGNILYDIGNERRTKAYSFNTGTWYHIAFTYKKGSYKKIYVNGAEIDSVTSTSTMTGIGSVAFIGASQNADTTVNANYLNGYLNDVRIYDHCISPIEIKRISQGLVLHYKLDDLNLQPANMLLNSGPHLNATTSWSARSGSSLAVVESDFGPYGYVLRSTYGTSCVGVHHQPKDYTELVNGETYTFSGWARASETCTVRWYNEYFTTQPQVELTTEWQFVYTTGVINTSNTYHSDICYPVTSTSDLWIEVCMWKLEKGSKPTDWIPHVNDTIYKGFMGNITQVSDSSGYGRSGTIIGAPILQHNQSRYKYNTHFSAKAQHIQCAPIQMSNFGNSFSIAWWGRRSTHSGTMFWGFSDGNNLNGMYNGTLWNTGDGSNNPIYKPNTTTTITAPAATNWHHYIMTGNGTKARLYVDGQLYGEAKTYKGLTGTQIYINGWNSASNYSNTDMDMCDFRIYATTLSDADILELYHTAAKMDNQKNFYTFEFFEDGIGAGDQSVNEIIWSNDMSSDRTGESSAVVVATYTTTDTPAPKTKTQTIRAGYKITFTEHIVFDTPGVYRISYPASSIANAYKFSYTPSHWQRSGSSYKVVYGSTSKRYYGQIRYHLTLYDSNGISKGSLIVINKLVSGTWSSSSASYPANITNGYIDIDTIDIQNKYGQVAYAQLNVTAVQSNPTNPTFNNGSTFTVKRIKEFDPYPVKPQLLQSGIFITQKVNEPSNCSNIKIYRNGSLDTSQAIEY